MAPVGTAVLRNSQGTEVDPVPFLVTAVCAFLVCLSFGPPYLVEVLGTSIATGVAGSLVVFLGLGAAAWHQLVWTHSPGHRDQVPASVRIRKLYYGMGLLLGVMVLLMIPLM